MSLKWEVIVPDSNYDSTERLKVPGGWIVCRIDGGKNPRMFSSIFVSDPKHEWNPNEEKPTE